ncbi:hypothetical protein Pfo_007566 [Paulownia fortunei]|nr:hypothetical protein Pfo_007566 [Paulownia fortunei]
MSGGEGRKTTEQEIDVVKNYIEQCIQNYMNKKEAINTLAIQANIDPTFTKIVWERLEKENQEFFKAYYAKLLVKDQIIEFNRLLSQQVELMHQSGLTGITNELNSNRSHVMSRQLISTPNAAQSSRHLKAEQIQQLNVFYNNGSSTQPCVRGTFDRSVHSREIDVAPNMFLSQNPNVGLAQTMNGQIVKTEAGYAGRSTLNFSSPGNFLESRPLMGDASMTPFSSVESNAQHPNDFLLDWDACFLDQYQQTFTPEFTADSTSSSDLQDGNYRPPSLPTDANFGNPHGKVELLDPASETLRYPFFGSD